MRAYSKVICSLRKAVSERVGVGDSRQKIFDFSGIGCSAHGFKPPSVTTNKAFLVQVPVLLKAYDILSYEYI